MSSSNPVIVLLHGYWHGSWCWAPVIAELAARDRPAVAVDMAGQGLNARWPAAARARTTEVESFATERSPVAGVTLDAAGELVISQLRSIGRGRACVLVAHSMGGAVATRAAQQAPELVSHLVYLAGFMPASGRPAFPYVIAPENAGELLGPALSADPLAVGAFRLDTTSPDPNYREQLRMAFYNDVDVAIADSAIAMLTSDGAVGIATGSTDLTAAAWGSIPRTYILCTRDNVIRPALQRRFIAEADAAFPDNPTNVTALNASHSPFLSMPDRVADLLADLKPVVRRRAPVSTRDQ